jgi:aquaporin Z
MRGFKITNLPFVSIIKNKKMKNYLVEFIGTFFLVLVIGLVTSNPNSGPMPMAPIAIGSILMVLVYMGGPVSGAHYNPAVTLSVVLRGKMNSREAIAYMTSQITGALAAAFFFYLIFAVPMGAPAPAAGYSYDLKPLMAEIIFTFVLVLVILNVATSKKSAGNSYFGLAIGFTVMASAFSVGSISGGAFNPAVGFGPILVDTLMGGTSISHLWLYLVGPFAGGILAAWVYRLTNPDEFMTE